MEAQIQLSSLYASWVMDARYYTKRVQLAETVYMSLIFIDTSPCVSEYRSSDPTGWDPCGSQYPTCSLSGGTDPFEGTCEFNKNILTQDCSAQLGWFKSALGAVPKTDWLIIVGHHPLDELDVRHATLDPVPTRPHTDPSQIPLSIPPRSHLILVGSRPDPIASYPGGGFRHSCGIAWF